MDPGLWWALGVPRAASAEHPCHPQATNLLPNHLEQSGDRFGSTNMHRDTHHSLLHHHHGVGCAGREGRAGQAGRAWEVGAVPGNRARGQRAGRRGQPATCLLVHSLATMETCTGAGHSQLEHLTSYPTDTNLLLRGANLKKVSEFLSHLGSVPQGRGLFGNPKAGFAALSSHAHGHLEQKTSRSKV